MKTQVRKLATAIIIGLFGVASGAALAGTIETQHSAYGLAAQLSAAPAQSADAAAAGPSEVHGRERPLLDGVPFETMYDAFNTNERSAASPSGQAGRAGPSEMPGRERPVLDGVPFETMYDAFNRTEEN